MKRLILLVAFVPLAFGDTLTTPDNDGGPYCLSPAFSSAACSITTQYDAGGLVFGATIPGVASGVSTATFYDAPDAWGGITAGTVDLLSAVDVQVVVPGSTTQGVTSSVTVEAGYSDNGSLLLSVYDASGNLLGSRVNGLDGLGPDDRTLITLSDPGIAFFTVTTPGEDTFGVDQITVGDITTAGGGGGGGATVPEPTSLLLLGSCLFGLVPTLRRSVLRRRANSLS